METWDSRRQKPCRFANTTLWELAKTYITDEDSPDLTPLQQEAMIQEATRLGWEFMQEWLPETATRSGKEEKLWAADGPGITVYAFEHKWQQACEAVRCTDDYYFDALGAKVKWED